MSTLGLWTSDLGLTIFPRASGAGRPGSRSLTRLTLTLCWTFTRRLTDVGKVKIRDQGNHQDRNNHWPHLRHQDNEIWCAGGRRHGPWYPQQDWRHQDWGELHEDQGQDGQLANYSLIYVEMLWSINYQFVFHGTKNKMKFQEQVVTIITFL